MAVRKLGQHCRPWSHCGPEKHLDVLRRRVLHVREHVRVDSSVMLTCFWLRRLDPTVMGTPVRRSSVALVCRKLWMLMAGKPVRTIVRV